MTRTQKKRFMRILETRRDELIRAIRERREHLAVEYAGDPVEMEIPYALAS
jgi:hypothetical protein